MLSAPARFRKRPPALLAGLLFALAIVGAEFACKAAEQQAALPRAKVLEADVGAASAAPTPAEIGSWVAQLQHDSFVMRQAAVDQLFAAGLRAREPLLKIADGPEPESRAAARRLITLIDKADFSRRLEAFADDIDGKQGLTLPGWTEFSKLVGSGKEARVLFVEMQRQESGLLGSFFEEDAGSLGARWEERLVQLLQWQLMDNHRVAPPIGSCATMLFLGTLEQADVSDSAADFLARLVDRPPIQSAMQRASSREAVRRLVVGWVCECPNRSDSALQQRLNLALTQKLHEAVPWALQIAQSDPTFLTTLPVTRGMAILLIGRLGTREHADDLEPLLDDASVCWTVQAAELPGPNRTVQIRDIALVVLLQMTGQNPADYGYVQARRQQEKLYAIETLYLENDGNRVAAVAKWRAWKAAQQSSSAAAE